MVIAAPSKDYTDDEIKKIREWMNNGGNLGRNLAVFVNYQADCPNLYEYLNVDFGIEVTNNIIIETDVNRQYAYNQYYPVSYTHLHPGGTGIRPAFVPSLGAGGL